MHTYLFFSFLSLNWIFGPVVAQAAQDPWIVPAGPDFTRTLYNGQTIGLSWDGWDVGAIETYLDEEQVNDLWVTSYNYAAARYSQLLAENINVSQPGSYKWTVNISDSNLSRTDEYVLRFKNPASSYVEDEEQLLSPGFTVLDSPSTTSTVASPTPTHPVSPPSGLSTAAKAGIGVGSAAGGLAVLSALVFAFLWRRQKAASSANEARWVDNESQKPPLSEEAETPTAMEILPPVELASTPLPPVELPEGRNTR